MNRTKISALLSLLVITASAAGCATVRPRNGSPEAKAQVEALQYELQQKDEEIRFLEDELARVRRSSPLKKQGQALSSPVIGRSVDVSVRSVQQALRAAGYYKGPVDGKAGEKTREAIKAFQRANGLTADGVVGRQTWKKLNRY